MHGHDVVLRLLLLVTAVVEDNNAYIACLKNAIELNKPKRKFHRGDASLVPVGVIAKLC